MDTPVQWYAVAETLLRQARARWRRLLAFALVGGVAGGGTALLLPSYYQSGAAFQAESNPSTPLSGALAGLASQVGNLQLTAPNAQFFGDLLTTDAVLRRLTSDSFPWRGRLVALPAIYGFDGNPDGLRVYNTVKKLRNALTVGVTTRTGVVRFAVEARTPELARVLAESTLASLNAANVDFRRERAAAERSFTADRANHARAELHTAEQGLAEFYQRNRSIANSPALQIQEGQLKRQVDMAQQVYVQLRLQEEQAAVQEVRNTPAITVIDPPVTPVRRSWPNRRFATIAGLMIGLALSSLSILLEKDQRDVTR